LFNIFYSCNDTSEVISGISFCFKVESVSALKRVIAASGVELFACGAAGPPEEIHGRSGKRQSPPKISGKSQHKTKEQSRKSSLINNNDDHQMNGQVDDNDDGRGYRGNELHNVNKKENRARVLQASNDKYLTTYKEIDRQDVHEKGNAEEKCINTDEFKNDIRHAQINAIGDNSIGQDEGQHTCDYDQEQHTDVNEHGWSERHPQTNTAYDEQLDYHAIREDIKNNYFENKPQNKNAKAEEDQNVDINSHTNDDDNENELDGRPYYNNDKDYEWNKGRTYPNSENSNQPYETNDHFEEDGNGDEVHLNDDKGEIDIDTRNSRVSHVNNDDTVNEDVTFSTHQAINATDNDTSNDEASLSTERANHTNNDETADESVPLDTKREIRASNDATTIGDDPLCTARPDHANNDETPMDGALVDTKQNDDCEERDYETRHEVITSDYESPSMECVKEMADQHESDESYQNDLENQELDVSLQDSHRSYVHQINTEKKDEDGKALMSCRSHASTVGEGEMARRIAGIEKPRGAFDKDIDF